MIRVYSQAVVGQRWIAQFRGQKPHFVCVLGFTETGLIPGISAAGATPSDRQLTAIADAEFLINGPRPQPQYPLPPLITGASPVLITRAITAEQAIPVDLFNAGLLRPPSVPCIPLSGRPARCLSQGQALDPAVVEQLLTAGLTWGKKLAAATETSYLILGECVVGGTTTALAVLTGLGWQAAGKVNSSHPICNHQQKWQIVSQGVQTLPPNPTPIQVVAAVGDPMQIAVAGMAIAASQTCGVLLAGGTQMLAVYALMQSLDQHFQLSWKRDRVVVGTTRWVAEDPTGDTVGLATLLGAPLLATQLSFAKSVYAPLRAYEQGYVKEGVGAGGCAIAAHLYQGWGQVELLQAIETLVATHQQLSA